MSCNFNPPELKSELIWGRRGGQHIKILLALKDYANLTLLSVREKRFWSGKSQGILISHLCGNPVINVKG